MKKKLSRILLIMAMLSLCVTGCGKKKEKNLEGTCAEILNQVYENANFDAEFKESLAYFETTNIPPENAEYMIGTADVEYTDSIYSAPMMSATAYQCILLRVAEGQDIEQTKQTIKENADPRKWICVEAESTIVENVGDVVLFIMADQQAAEAVVESFRALAE